MKDIFIEYVQIRVVFDGGINEGSTIVETKLSEMIEDKL